MTKTERDAFEGGDRLYRWVPNSSCLQAYVGLLAEGRTAFDEIEVFRGDDLFREALALVDVPSSPTLRQRLTKADGAFDDCVRRGNVRFLSGCSLGTLSTAAGERGPVDVDVSC